TTSHHPPRAPSQRPRMFTRRPLSRKPRPTGPRVCRLRRCLLGVVPSAQRLEIVQRVIVSWADVVHIRGLLCAALTRVRPDMAALVPVTGQHSGTTTPPVPGQTLATIRTGPAHGPPPFFPALLTE